MDTLRFESKIQPTFDDALLRKCTEVPQFHITRQPPLCVPLELVADRLLRLFPPRYDHLEGFPGRVLQLQSDRLANRALYQGGRLESRLALDGSTPHGKKLIALEMMKQQVELIYSDIRNFKFERCGYTLDLESGEVASKASLTKVPLRKDAHHPRDVEIVSGTSVHGRTNLQVSHGLVMQWALSREGRLKSQLD